MPVLCDVCDVCKYRCISYYNSNKGVTFLRVDGLYALFVVIIIDGNHRISSKSKREWIATSHSLFRSSSIIMEIIVEISSLNYSNSYKSASIVKALYEVEEA